MSIYLDNSWQPLRHTIVKDKNIETQIHEKGFSVQKLVNAQTLEKLQALFDGNHDVTNENGGMFYSIYSQDLEYRSKMHEEIAVILKPEVDNFCKDYKMVLNSFVVKVSGPNSEFYLHQDTTGLDEFKHSPLSLWIPLEEVNEDNGCLGIVPSSHQFFSPYRSISFPAPFDHIQSTIKKYLQPLRMKAGELLVFDNRILHHSYQNSSNKLRIAVICGLFPENADIITCYKPVYECGGQVELIKQDDRFLLTYKNFLVDCHKRPDVGESMGLVNDPYDPISAEEFEQLCSSHGLSVSETDEEILNRVTSCDMIGEPVAVEMETSVNAEKTKPSLWEKIKKIF